MKTNKIINQMNTQKAKAIIAFAFLFVFGTIQLSAQTIYVNDTSVTGDTYTSARGSDVTGTGSSSAPYASIYKAVTVASAGSTIKVDAGTYSTAFTVNKTLTLQGTNVGTLGSGTRVAESIIKDVVVTISGSSVVVLDGFHIYQTTTATGATVAVGNTPTTIQNCKIERVGSTGGVNAYGIQTTMSSTAAITIQRNLFTGSLAGSLFSSHRTWNSGIYSNGGTNITITNNTMQNCRTAISSDNQSSGVTISNNTFSNNGTHIAFGGSAATSGSYALSGNTFAVTSGLTTINLSNVTTSFRLDLTNNTFGSTAASSLSISQCFDVENTMVHKGGSSKNGLITIQTGKLFKTSTTTFANNISYATAGDAIYVSSGTFTEAITLNKAVNLYGNNYNVNPNTGSWAQNGSRASESILSGVGITIATSGVEVSGFKIINITSSGVAIGNTNPASTYSNATIKNNWITGLTNTHPIWFTASSGQAYDGFQILNNRIENNTVSVSSNLVTSIDMWRSGNHTISGNYIDGGKYNGIKSDGYQNSTITGNYISNCKVAGISVQATYANNQVVSVTSNTITGCQEGIAVWSTVTTYPNSKLTITDNNITMNVGKLDINYPAIAIQNTSSGDGTANTVARNTITLNGTFGSSPYGVFPSSASAAYGILLLGDVGRLNLTSNVIDGASVAGVNVSANYLDMTGVMLLSNFPIGEVSPVNTALAGTINFANNDIKGFKNGFSCYNYTSPALAAIPNTTTLTVNNNSIVPTIGGYAFITATGGAGMDASCNWYGSTSYATVASRITGNVTFVSFLVSGTDNEGGTIGFQPQSGVCTGVEVSTPTTGSSAAVFTSISQNEITFTFTKGNGAKRIIVAKNASESSTNPTNNTSYASNAAYGSGDALDGYVVYNNDGQSATITNLTAGNLYYFSIYEYNYSGANIQYATSVKYTTSATTLQPDADADGVADADDEYPTDVNKAFNNRYPSSSYATLMFEDLWPGKGDYDFNDLVLNYQYNTITNAANQVVEVRYSFVTRAIGGSLHNAFAFQLDSINPNKITSVTGSKATAASWLQLNSNGTEAGQGDNANIVVFDDAYKLLPVQSGFSFVNVYQGSPDSGKDTTTIVVKFIDNGVIPSGGAVNYSSFGTNLFNPYIILNQVRGKEVHLADRVPSAKVDASFFGLEQDRTNPGTGTYYKTANNLPWAINISSSIPYPQEKTDISEAYLKFIPWSTSNGATNQTWYLDTEGNRNASKLIIR